MVAIKMAQTPTTAELPATIAPEPYRSTNRPANGEISRPHNAPKLTAPENNPRDQSKCSVMGITNTDNTDTDATGRAPKLGSEAIASTTHP